MPASRQFSGFGLGFGLGGVAGDEETSAVVVFVVEGVGGLAKSQRDEALGKCLSRDG